MSVLFLVIMGETLIPPDPTRPTKHEPVSELTPESIIPCTNREGGVIRLYPLPHKNGSCVKLIVGPH